MIRLRLEAWLLGAASRLGRNGPNRELERFARELADLARRPAPGADPRQAPAEPMRDR